MTRRWRWVAAAALLSTVAACTGTAGGGVSGAASETGSPAAGKAVAAAADDRLAVGRALIKSADMDIEAANVASAVDSAEIVATGSGGEVVSLDRSNLSLPSARADLTLRVPAAQFDGTVADLARLAAPGTNVRWHKDIQDVTDTVVDVNARISAQRHALTRLQNLLNSAKNLDQVIRLESELTRREADLVIVGFAALWIRRRLRAEKHSMPS